MAHGTILTEGNLSRLFCLLDAAGGTTDGVWVELLDFRKEVVLETTGISGDTIEIDGSNAATKPANTDHGTAITTVTLNGFKRISDPPRFVKARVTVFGAGAITANLIASK